MPSYRMHLAAGIGLFLLFVLVEEKLSIVNFLTYLAIALVYSLLPDIDASNSKIGKWSRFLLLTAAVIAYFLNFVALSVFLVAIVMFLTIIKHRGFIHTFRASLLLALPLLVFKYDSIPIRLGNV